MKPLLVEVFDGCLSGCSFKDTHEGATRHSGDFRKVFDVPVFGVVVFDGTDDVTDTKKGIGVGGIRLFVEAGEKDHEIEQATEKGDFETLWFEGVFFLHALGHSFSLGEFEAVEVEVA